MRAATTVPVGSREPTSPLDAFARAATLPGVAFLHGGGTPGARSWLAWEPRRRLEIDPSGHARVDGAGAVVLDPLVAIERFVAEETACGRTVIGALSYDLRHWTEPSAKGVPSGSLPVALLLGYDDVARYDGATGAWSGSSLPRAACVAGRARLAEVATEVGRDRYRALFDRLRGALLDGEIYQANLAIPFDARLTGRPADLFRDLASRHPVPYGAYLDAGSFQILCNSPELLLRLQGRRLETRPIKGTRPRAPDAAADAATVGELISSEKERAEHVMIVDLERSDLGRIAVTGSVRVEALATVATYPTLHHLESSITAELRGGVRLAEMLLATFPGGSITGAPKIRAMHWIDGLEVAPREFYTGSIFLARPDGELVVNVAIRCAVARGDRLRYFAGGGIVVDSEADLEYAECLLKAKAFFAAGGVSLAGVRS